MGKEPVVPEGTKNILSALQGLLKAREDFKNNPCISFPNEGGCADHDLAYGEFCPNCKKVWEDTSSIMGQTPGEALEYAQGFKNKQKKKEEISELCDLPCTKENIHGNCAEQNIPVADMCDNCKKFWTVASAEAGQTPEQAVETAKAFRAFVLSQGERMGMGGTSERQAN